MFLQIFAAPDVVKDSLHLSGLSCSDFRYTGGGDVECNIIEGVPDGERFLQTMQILDLLGINIVQRKELQRIVAGIMFLGQVPFLGDDDKSYVDPAYSKETAACCDLLGLEQSSFDKKTTVRRISTGEGEMLVSLSQGQASDGRDALAKDIYDRLFQWLVIAINESTAAHSLEQDRSYRGNERIIALLDIFGFESFQVNRFEQLCINYANEKLQQKFTQDVFLAVQVEYKEEGLLWEQISYADNAQVLELLEGRLGIMALLNEECLVPRGSDMNFLAKISINNNKHPCFSSGGLEIKREEFCVSHYAGKVIYSTTGFVERNRDALPSESKQLMLSSSNEVLKKIFSVESASEAPQIAPRGGRSKQSFMKADTVTTKFRSQLSSLMETIGKTDVQYVRCIKPNAQKSRDIFDRNMVVEQLRCAGMIEAIRISRAAYPYRITHSEFASRFRGLRFAAWMRSKGAVKPVEQCKVLLIDVLAKMSDSERKKMISRSVAGGAPDHPYEIGRTRVYFSAGLLELLEEMRGAIVHTHIRSIQRIYRGSRQRKQYLKLKGSVLMIQKIVRGWSSRQRFIEVRRSVITAQSLCRSWLARRLVAKIRNFTHTIRLQAWIRMVNFNSEPNINTNNFSNRNSDPDPNHDTNPNPVHFPKP